MLVDSAKNCAGNALSSTAREIKLEPPAPPHSSRLIVDCDAIAANFQFLAKRVAPAECGAVIKAAAYGLGIADVAPALLPAGCRSFFVARLCEAERLRRLVGSGCKIGRASCGEGGCQYV